MPLEQSFLLQHDLQSGRNSFFLSRDDAAKTKRGEKKGESAKSAKERKKERKNAW